MSHSVEKDKLNLLNEVITPLSLVLIKKIGEFNGKHVLLDNQRAEYLDQLQYEALVNNTIASNRIDNLDISRDIFEELFSEIREPENDVESEVLRYVKVLNQISSHFDTLQLNSDLILQFHRNLFRYKPGNGGKWKPLDNVIERINPDGSTSTVFIPVSAEKTTEEINELCMSYNCWIQDETLLDLVVIAAFLLDFLCIHPFTVGNGRVARLLTHLLLYKQGYKVVKYFSLDEVVYSNKAKYFYSLNKSSQNWHEKSHNLSEWIEFFLWTIYTSYFELDKKLFIIKNKKGAKSQQVKMVIDSLSSSFKVSEIAAKCPGIARPTINKMLQELRDSGYIMPLSLGRDAVWQKTEL